MSLLRKTYKGLKGLLSGLGMTLHYFVRFDKVITQQYPENRETLKLPERFHGQIELIKDPATGLYKCNTCGLCVKACPNNSIALEKVRDPATKKFRLRKYEYHLERCSFCGLCVDACKFDALKMGAQFENAAYDPQTLRLILNDDYQQQATAASAPQASDSPPTQRAAENPPKDKP